MLKYSSLFLQFLCTLLSDTSRDIIYATHDILRRIISIPGFNSKANYSELIRVLCDKNFSAQDPNVRLEGQNIMRDVMKVMKAKYYIGVVS